MVTVPEQAVRAPSPLRLSRRYALVESPAAVVEPLVSVHRRWAAVAPVSGNTGSAIPLWFGPTARQLFGWVHRPSSGTAQAGVVLCPPLGREAIVAHYSYRRLAQELSKRGFLVVRFDYDGTGNSTGDDSDPDRVIAWQRSIADAAELARQCGVTSLVVVGMRMGALLASSMAAQIGADALVAWDPCSSGRSFVREQHAVQRLHFGALAATPGAVELPGFVFAAQTVADLGELNYALRDSAVAQALVLTRPRVRVPDDWRTPATGSHLDVKEVDGQEQLLEVDPLHQQIPLAAISQITEWLSSRMTGPVANVSSPASHSARITLGDGSEIVERALRMGSTRLFGIESTRAQGSTGPAMIFVTSSFDPLIGPNRMWVDLARRWAGAGMRCIRLDVSGIGDSPSRSGHLEHVMRSADAFDDLAEAAEAIGDPANQVWIGLCSGGYQSMEALLAFEARGACVVNPVFRFEPPEMRRGAVDPRRRLCWTPSALFRMERRLASAGRTSHKVASILAKTTRNGSEQIGFEWMSTFAGLDARTLCIVGDREGAEIGAMTSASTPDGHFELQVLPELDHALMPAAQRTDVMNRLTRFVEFNFGASTENPPARAADRARAKK